MSYLYTDTCRTIHISTLVENKKSRQRVYSDITVLFALSQFNRSGIVAEVDISSRQFGVFDDLFQFDTFTFFMLL
jgi:hypothetical protein